MGWESPSGIGKRSAVWCPLKHVEAGLFSFSKITWNTPRLSLKLLELLKPRHNQIVPTSSSAI